MRNVTSIFEMNKYAVRSSENLLTNFWGLPDSDGNFRYKIDFENAKMF